MPSRRRLLGTVGVTAIGGFAGCLGHVRDAMNPNPPISGACPTQDVQWPTGGGDPGRTGRTDTSPPPTDGTVDTLLPRVGADGRRRLAGALPAVGDGTAFVPAGSGIVAVNLQSSGGESRWEYELDDDVDAIPALACGVVLVPSLNSLTALDPATGERHWKADEGGHNPTSVAAVNETAFLAGGNFHAFDIRSGKNKWNAEGGDTLAVDDGVYTTLNRNGTGGIFAHDFDGQPRWHLSLGKIVGSASVLDGTVWVADNDGTVYSIDAFTGETNWSRNLSGVEKIHSGVAVRGADVVVPAGTGETSLVLDATTGEPRWKVESGIVTGRPVVGDDWIALGRTNIGVTVYDRSSGEERATWSRNEYGLGTVDGIVPIEEGFLVRVGTTSGLSLIR